MPANWMSVLGTKCKVQLVREKLSVDRVDDTGDQCRLAVPCAGFGCRNVDAGEPLFVGTRTFKYSDRGRVIVYTSCSFKSSDYDGGRGYKIVGKGIVEISLEQSVQLWNLPEAPAFQAIPPITYLKLKYVLDAVKLLFVSEQDHCQRWFILPLPIPATVARQCAVTPATQLDRSMRQTSS